MIERLDIRKLKAGYHGTRDEIQNAITTAKQVARNYFDDDNSHQTFMYGSRLLPRRISLKAYRYNMIGALESEDRADLARSILGLFDELNHRAAKNDLASNQLATLSDSYPEYQRILLKLLSGPDSIQSDFDFSIQGRQVREVLTINDENTGAIYQFHAADISRFPEYWNK